MKETTEDDRINKLREVKWKTHLSKQLEEFSAVISDDKIFEKYFGVSYVEKLTCKSREITKTVIKLGVIYSALMLSLFASHNISQSEFEILGYGFKNLGAYKEILLLLAVSISPVTAVMLAYQKYINALANECIKKLSPDAKIRKFYSYTFIDNYFDWLSTTNRQFGPSTYRHGFAVFIAALLGVTLLFLLITLLAGSFFIQISVIYDVATKPATSQYVNLFVLVYAITSILFSWLVSIIQFPMPEVDLSNYSRLDAIKKGDPDKYRELMKRIAAEDSKKEAISLIVLSAIIYMSSFTAIAVYWFSSALNDLVFFLSKGMPGAFFVLFFSNEIIGFIRKSILAWFFRNYPDNEPDRLRIFGKVQKILLLNKVVVPASLSVGYTLYVFSLGN
jgi:hypothetical protein